LALILVPTPLGNLQDITLRALEVLRACDLVAAEDTRVARRLLSAHGIEGKRLVSYREQNAARVTPMLLRAAEHGTLALTTDAGMPGVSDPGRELVQAAYAAGIAVEVLPGPVAFVTAAVLAGYDVEGLLFAGFLPKGKSKLERALRAAATRAGTTAFYESPHRIVKTLEALERVAPETEACVVRELTKKFEQRAAGSARAILDELDTPVRGEIVLLVCGSAAGATKDVPGG
jgi:16S rRNA (cytidine1402-2'-O)-methyltransferase